MVNDILVILMMAFGLFAIAMFILFYVYLKAHYNNKHNSDDYTKDIEQEENDKYNSLSEEEFIPKKKK